MRSYRTSSRAGTARENGQLGLYNRTLSCISKLEIFTDLLPHEISEIDHSSATTHVSKGKVIYSPEDNRETLFLIKEGRVQLYRISIEGRKLVLAMLGPETFFGEMPLFGQAMGDTVAQAVDDVMLCTLGRAEVERILLTYPRIALRLIQVLNERLQEAEERLHESAFLTMPARTAALLLRLAEESNEISGLTHQDLADMLGVYRETVTATLDKLKQDELLKIGRKRITLSDRSALEELVQGIPRNL
jgi:CRP-like cAMP-binding protein